MKKKFILKEQGDANHFCIIDSSNKWVIGFIQNGEMPVDEQRKIGEKIVRALNSHDLFLYYFEMIFQDLDKDDLSVNFSQEELDEMKKLFFSAKGEV